MIFYLSNFVSYPTKILFSIKIDLFQYLAAYSASLLRGYPVGAIPISTDANLVAILGKFENH